MQRQVWTVFGVALAISLVIGWLASRHAARLERRLTEQHDAKSASPAILQRLSARLVQAREEEQRRIARELHDEVGQALSAVKVQLAVAERRIETDGRAPDRCSPMRSRAPTAALHSVRDLSHLLHPSALDDLGLVAALESLVADFRRRHQIAIEFPHDGHDRRLHAETERAIYRIVQEALTNIARHAEATGGSVQLDDRSSVGPRHDRGQRHRIRCRRCRTAGQAARVGPSEHPRACDRTRGQVRIESAPAGSRIDVELPAVPPSRIDDLDPDLVASLIDSEVNRG